MRNYKGKKVAILGLSVEGIDSVKYFTHQGAWVVCCDRRTKEALGDAYRELSRYPITFQLGSGYLDNLNGYDVLIRTPGMSLRLAELAALQKAGKQITSLTKLFFDLCPAPIIGVTGTKGKGTTSTLIANMLEKHGKRVFLGGNVGTPLLSKLEGMRRGDWVVLELSSFQLEDLHKSPHIGVVLRITQDHLANYDRFATNFHPSREAYVEAKKTIVCHQRKDDIGIFNADDPIARSFSHLTPARAYTFGRVGSNADAYVKNHTVYVRWKGRTHTLCSRDTVKLLGDHNLENIAAAALAALAAGAAIKDARDVSRTFKGLEHRLEYVGTAGGVSYINDSFSTVPETTIAAIQSFTEPLVLIVGGSEKRSDFTEMARAITGSNVKTVIAIGDMTGRIVDALKKASFRGEIIAGCRSMHEVIQRASQQAAPGNVVLLSPACASFDMFANYKDRGKQFRYEVSHINSIS